MIFLKLFRFWSLKDEYSEWRIDDSSMFVLPSDSLKREDLVCIKKENWDDAQKEKEKLENQQRADKKLRGHK